MPMLTNKCHCGKEIYKDRKYCSFACRSADPVYCNKISSVKTKLYQDPIWKETTEKKKIATTRKNFGVDYPMQNIEIFEKQQAACFEKDENGLHGYEPHVFGFLKQLYPEIILGTDYLKSKNLRIQWIGKDNKFHRSYPDFFIESMNSFVEIKSEYTYSLHREKLTFCEKELYNMKYGYIICIVRPNKQFQFWLYNNKYIED